MSLITVEQLPAYNSQDRVDARINALPLSELQFSHLTSLYGRMFGVLTGTKDGEWIAITDEKGVRKSDVGDRFTLNHCVRWQYPGIADGVIAETEAELGYALTDRYIVEEQRLTSPLFKFQTKMPGVVAFNVTEIWGDVIEDVPLKYVIEEDVPVVSINANTYAARISSTLFPNPNEVVLRTTDLRAFPWFSDGTSPLRRDTLGGYWEMPLNSVVRAYTPGTQIDVQSKRYVQVTISAPEDLPVGAVVFPVYPGTQQKIPQAQEMEILESGDWRYTFYIYTLVHPEFASESVDLIAGEFYKLYPVIDFKYTVEAEIVPTIIIRRGATESTLEPTLSLVDAELGIFHVNYDSCWRDWQCVCEDWPTTVMLRYAYKTSPTRLSLQAQDHLTKMRGAIAARIAAELPTYNCNCPVPYGFIMKNQTAYTESYIATQSGVVVDKLKYGRLEGQLAYAEALNQAPKYRKHADASIVL